MVEKRETEVHKMSGTIVWLGERQKHTSFFSGKEYEKRKIMIEKNPGCKLSDSAYFVLYGDMALDNWKVGDRAEVHFTLCAYETNGGKKGTCLICREIKKIDDVRNVNV